jgi:hypothetical protein
VIRRLDRRNGGLRLRPNPPYALDIDLAADLGRAAPSRRWGGLSYYKASGGSGEPLRGSLANEEIDDAVYRYKRREYAIQGRLVFHASHDAHYRASKHDDNNNPMPD